MREGGEIEKIDVCRLFWRQLVSDLRKKKIGGKQGILHTFTYIILKCRIYFLYILHLLNNSIIGFYIFTSFGFYIFTSIVFYIFTSLHLYILTSLTSFGFYIFTSLHFHIFTSFGFYIFTSLHFHIFCIFKLNCILHFSLLSFLLRSILIWGACV